MENLENFGQRMFIETVKSGFLCGDLQSVLTLNPFDLLPGKLIHAMVAHLDAVTCLAVEPNGIYLISGSESPSMSMKRTLL